MPVQEKRGRVFIGKVKLCTSTPSFLVPTSSSSIFLPQFLTFATSHTSPCSITSLSLYLLFLCDYPRALCLWVPLSLSLITPFIEKLQTEEWVCSCVCVRQWERERERESEWVNAVKEQKNTLFAKEIWAGFTRLTKRAKPKTKNSLYFNDWLLLLLSTTTITILGFPVKSLKVLA